MILFICDFVLIRVVVRIVKLLFFLIFFVVLKKCFGWWNVVGLIFLESVFLFGGIIKL